LKEIIAMQKTKKICLQLSQVALVLFLVTFLVTVLVRLLPGDIATTLLPFGTKEELDLVRTELGTNSNVFVYYFRWLGNFLQGDLGVYYNAGEDYSSASMTVWAMLSQTIPRTLLIMVYTLGFSLLCSVPLGMLLAYKADTRTDKVTSNILFGLSSIPNFAVGLGLAYIIGVKFALLNPIGYVTWAEGPAEHIKSVIMPVLSLSLGLIASFTRLLRADIISTLKEDFVTMASSKGLSNRWILWRHVFRPSSLSLLTAAALNMGSLIGGAVVIEIIFALNGVGMFLVTSIARRQYLAIQSTVALIAIAYVVFNLIVDAFMPKIDPRIRSHRGA
jgi:peptide/nickel transport system permease protein